MMVGFQAKVNKAITKDEPFMEERAWYLYYEACVSESLVTDCASSVSALFSVSG